MTNMKGCFPIVLNVKTKQKTICVHNMFLICSELGTRNSMNNLSTYCGLVEAKMRASDKYLPLQLPICVCGPCLWLIPSCQKSCGIWS